MAEVVTPRIRIGNQQPVKVRLRVLPSQAPMQIELRNTGTMIQWRYLGRDWQDLITIDSINASVTVGTVETLPAGTPAYVVNVGTPQDVVLNFGIPKGPIESVNGDPGPAVVLDAGDIAVTPVGSIGSTTVQAAIAELDAEKQPLDSDLTAIAALSTTTYGRSLLTLAGASGLAAEVDAFFLTPSEGNAAYQPLDGDLTAIAALTTQAFGRARLTDAGAEDARNALDTAPYVANRTALKALDTTKDTVALLNGFAWVWSAGDFSTHITTDTQEGMFIKADAIASTSGAWRRAFVGAVHASWFGVDATASAAANKTALNAALAMSVFLNGGVVELPAGIISCNTGISHAGTKPLILRGQGMGVTTLNATAGANFMSIVPSPFSAVNIVFEDLTIEQAGGATTNAGLLVSRCTFRAFRVAVRGFAVGMYLDETYSFDIVECMFSGQATYGVQAVANTANNAAILRTFFGGIGKTGFGPALFLDSAEHILIQGNQFEDNYRDIRIDNCGSVAIIDNYMEYEDDYPINFVGTNSNVVIQRNWIALFSSTWTLENVVELTMTDNFLHNCTTTIAATCLRPIVERNKKTGTGTFPSVNVTPRVMESVQLADRTGSDVSTAQAVFASAQDALTVEADATYEFEAEYFITRAAGTTSHTTGVLFGGSATFDAVAYLAQVTNPTGNVLANVQQIWGAAATEVVLTAANTSATENLLIKLKGRIRTNAAGTIIPQFKYSAAPGGAPTIKANSAFRLWYLGSDQVAALGPWA